MRSPSARVLANYVSLYRFTPPVDADGAVQGDDAAYTTVIANAVKCSVQPQSPDRMTDQERMSAKSVWLIIFASDPGVRLNDRVTWVDTAGTTRKLIVTLARDLAGRGGAWEVRAEERV